jgi:hypothetical protein
MLPVGLWRWYISITIIILDIIYRPVFYLKHNLSETGFCLHLQLVQRLSIGPNWVGTTLRQRQNPVSEKLRFE